MNNTTQKVTYYQKNRDKLLQKSKIIMKIIKNKEEQIEETNTII